MRSSNDTYILRNLKSPDIVVDVSGYDSKSVIGYSDHGGSNQRWILKVTGAGPGVCWTTLRVQSSGLYLGVDTDGRSLIVQHDPYKWEVLSDGIYYRIGVVNSNLRATLSNEQSPAGTPIVLQAEPQDGAIPEQKWKLQLV